MEFEPIRLMLETEIWTSLFVQFEFTFICCCVILSYLFLLRTYYVPGPVARSGDTMEIKRNRSTLVELSGHRVRRQASVTRRRTVPALKSTQTLQHGTPEKGR